MAARRLTRRSLNRATLARQGLLAPIETDDVAAAVAAVGSLQAQHPEWPPVALWTRSGDHSVAGLVEALAARRVVRAALMRVTVHIVAAGDFWPIATLTQELRRIQFRSIFKADPFDSPLGRRLTATHAGVRAALRDGPLRIRDMDAIMKAEAPDLADGPNRMHWRHLAASIPMVHVPFDGEGYGRSRYAIAEDWIGPPPPELDAAAARRHVLERYLIAFGPASLDDLLAYVGARGGVTVWRDALRAMGDRVEAFDAEDGRVLHDLADAPRPGDDAPAPPRLLARWDSLLLSHAAKARQRVIDDAHRSAVYTKNADVLPSFLVDGRVAGTWDRDGRTVTLRPFGRLARADRRLLEEQAARLVRVLQPGAGDARVVVAR